VSNVWQVATVTSTRTETPSARSIQLDVPGWPGNIAGQHVDLRLTAPDGYTAVRSYSLASVGDSHMVELAVDLLPDGEVSPYLVEEVQSGDQLELRGPLGAWFVWRPEMTAPVQLIAGGSGIVPLMSMVRAHATSGSSVPFKLLYAVRSPEDVYFAEELMSLTGPLLEITFVYSRTAPAGWTVPAGRMTKDVLSATTFAPDDGANVFVCGPTAFVETVASWLVELGHDPNTVKTERFGGK